METRSSTRVNLELKVICRLDEESQQQFGLACGKSFEARVIDISVLGIGLTAKYFLPKGLILVLEIDGTPFNIPGAMKIKGEIRYSKFIRDIGYRCGVKFLDTSEEYKKAIAQFISTHERRKEPRVKLSD